MKRKTTLGMVITLCLPAVGFAQADSTTSMEMKNMHQSNHAAMHVQGMDMQGMQKSPPAKGVASTSYKATGTVKAADPAAGSVTLAHGPVRALNWPAMTMTFLVKEKALFNKLVVGKPVNVEFVSQGGKYVVTAVN